MHFDGLKRSVVAVCGRGSGKCESVEMPSICPGNLPPAAIPPPRSPRGSPFLSACPGVVVKRDMNMAYVTVCDNNHDDDAEFQPGSALRLGVRETRMSLPRLPRGNSTPWGCRSKLEHLIGACSLSSRELFDLRPAISGPTALCCNRRLLLFPDHSSVEGMTTPAISLPDITSWRNEE
ncbi:hypothetical protein BO79DRAFT_223884 [Aspergillus costaricaensis CBS 115574]|uniref:Uncharacterized protein n=1 Tax=Aspergillus costaricaensis CBS 115574 TaxID=1448317 RepID=A0ACD1ISA1_9EURO|nr:hypothetical protein BO79DRAFT_223884 [Aspergillus costaricaensis CBS 115574]RAK93401.1 hypothetical protein BO79DRAFT_223884 [Aspergillus costaricaensis CBS 115574]